MNEAKTNKVSSSELTKLFQSYCFATGMRPDAEKKGAGRTHWIVSFVRGSPSRRGDERCPPWA